MRKNNAPTPDPVRTPIDGSVSVLGLGGSRTRELIVSGSLCAVRLGRRRMVAVDTLHRFIATFESRAAWKGRAWHGRRSAIWRQARKAQDQLLERNVAGARTMARLTRYLGTIALRAAVREGLLHHA